MSQALSTPPPENSKNFQIPKYVKFGTRGTLGTLVFGSVLYILFRLKYFYFVICKFVQNDERFWKVLTSGGRFGCDIIVLFKRTERTVNMINFEAIKAKLPIRDVAAYYGMDVKRGGMVNCLFHSDNSPSMKLYDDHYYCFGCHTHGDVIDLTAKLFSLRPSEAANKLCADFHIDAVGSRPAEIKLPYEKTAKYRSDEQECYLALLQYLKLLEFWERKYAPCGSADDGVLSVGGSVLNAESSVGAKADRKQAMGEDSTLCSQNSELQTPRSSQPDMRFVEACTMKEYVSYLCDIFISGSDKERLAAVYDLLPHIPDLNAYTKRKVETETEFEGVRSVGSGV